MQKKFQIFHKYQILHTDDFANLCESKPETLEDKRQKYIKRSVSRDLRHLGQAELLLAGGGVGRHNRRNLHLLPLLLQTKKSLSNKMNVRL
jgi:hypothetical protein